MNQYQSARMDEIRRRGIDCWKYGNIAEEQRKARADFQGVVNGLSGQRTNPAQIPNGITFALIKAQGSSNVLAPEEWLVAQTVEWAFFHVSEP